MADINIDSAVINAAAEELRQAKTIIDLQCNTLKEVAQIIETSYQCNETVRLKSCIDMTRQRLGRTGEEFKDIATSLQFALNKARMADTLKPGFGAFGGGNGGGGFR